MFSPFSPSLKHITKTNFHPTVKYVIPILACILYVTKCWDSKRNVCKKAVKQPPHDNGRRPNATCHLIDSGDLYRSIYFRQKLSENQHEVILKLFIALRLVSKEKNA